MRAFIVRPFGKREGIDFDAVQKLLIHSGRSADKKAQDVLYIHDTLELFGGALDELRRLWGEEVRPKIAKPWATRVEALAHELFAEVTDTPSRSAHPSSAFALPLEPLREASCDSYFAGAWL